MIDLKSNSNNQQHTDIYMNYSQTKADTNFLHELFKRERARNKFASTRQLSDTLIDRMLKAK